MLWRPVESPYTTTKKAAFKLLETTRKAIILLISSWHMKPHHFQPETNSVYRNLGWWLPLIPGAVYAWAIQRILAHMLEGTAFPEGCLLLCIAMLVVFMAHLTAVLGFCFHIAMCRLGRIFKLNETPPPYEFFLVRSTGGLMWLSIPCCLVALPIIQKEGGLTGRLAALLIAIPLLYGGLFLLALFSWMKAETTGKVGLQQMYHSERFITLFYRTEIGIAMVAFVLLVVLARHPAILTGAIITRR